MESYSGSRTPLIQNLPDGLQMLADDLTAKGVRAHFHVFSDDAVSGPNVKTLLAGQSPRNTNIAAGSGGMLSHFKGIADPPEHMVVVFISDGADSFAKEGLVQLGLLSPLPGKSSLLTVAVGNGFPTTTVLNALYGKYQTNEDTSLPLIFPIEPRTERCCEVMTDILQQMRDIVLDIASGVPRRIFTVTDLDGMDNAAILDVCRRCHRRGGTKRCL
jgi:hypothetical protein